MKSFKKPLLIVLGALLLLVLGATPAQAIQNGKPDGPAHRAVGILGFDMGGGIVFPFCTGFVISDSAFVTAAHCILFAPETGWVVTLEPGSKSDPVYTPGWFAPNFANLFTFHLNADTHAQHVYIHAGYDLNDPSTYANDIAVLTFAPGTFDVPPVKLPTAGMLDQLAADNALTDRPLHMVAYGSNDFENRSDGTWWYAPGYRQRGRTSITGLDPTYLLYAPTDVWPADGGPGDSGSPQFIAGHAVSLGSSIAWHALRLDTPNVLDFLAPFVNGD